LHCYVSQYAFSFIIYVAHTVNRSFQSYMYTTEIQCTTGHTSVAYLYKHLRPRNKISRERIRYVCAQLSAHSRALDRARIVRRHAFPASGDRVESTDKLCEFV